MLLLDCPNQVTVLPCRNGVEIRGAELYEYNVNGQWSPLLPAPCQQWSKSGLSCEVSTVFQSFERCDFIVLHIIGEPYPNRLDPKCRDDYFEGFQMIPGDVNLNGVADLTDFMLYRGTFIQQQWDFNRDGLINLTDLSDLHTEIVLRVRCP